MSKRSSIALALLAALPACAGPTDADAVAVVSRYNERVTAAYRAGDVRLVEAVAGPAHGRRLAGLIGVKLDQGITLDAELTSFSPLRVARAKDEIVVFTEERWYYRDRRIGTGEQVGDDSRDHYFMRYHLRRLEGRWLVDDVAFEREPEVGRTRVLNSGDVGSMHGVRTVEPGAGAAPSPPRGGAPSR